MGFNAYGLYLTNGEFGFDTAQGQLSGTFTTSNTSELVNQWALVDAEFYNGAINNGRLYINGVQQSLSQGGSPSPSYVGSTFNIGSLYEAPNSSILGVGAVIDEFAVYNGALSQAAIQAHYNAATAVPTCSDISGATTSSYQVKAADGGAQLRVNVTAHNDYGVATATSLSTAPAVVTAPTPAAPLDGGGVKTATPALSVDPFGGGGSVQYVFEVGADAQFSRQLATSGPLTDTTTWTVPTSAGLKDGQSFWWRAQAFTADGETGWSAAQKVTVRMVTTGSRPYWPMWTSGRFAVNEATGNLVLSLDGPSFSTPTGAMALGFTYNSQDTRDQGLGPGWTLSGGDPNATPPTTLIDHSRFASNDPDYYFAAEVDWPDGSSSFYSEVGSSGTYLSPPGDTSQLKRNVDGSWTLLDSDGSIYTFAAIASGATSTPLATAEQAAADANTDVLSYRYGVTSGGRTLLTEIDDSADPGRSIVLTWNALNASGCAAAIVCVTGPDGVEWQLAGASGAATSAPFATLNDGTRVVAALGYDATGQLTSYRNADDEAPTDPNISPDYNSQHSIQIGFDGTDSTARVTSFAEGPVTGLDPVSACPNQDPLCWTFAYHSGGQTDASQSHGGARDAAGWTEITPPNQQSMASPAKQAVYFDGLDHPIETRDALGRVSQAAYNGNDELVWQEDALGNPTDYTWDTLTDTLQSVLGPPNQNGQRPLTRYGYDEAAIGQQGADSSAWTPGQALNGLQAAYYPNLSLAGRPVLRNDAAVNFNWGDNPPAALPNSVGFSVRWSGYFVAPSAGDYTFTLAAASGQASALEIDGVQAIDNTVNPAASASSHQLTLTAGRHQISVEYVAASRPAQIQFSYSCADCNPVENEQTVPAADLLPGWNNQTSTVSPLGRISFSHFADPTSGQPDYTLQKLADGTPLITSYRYDSYGRLADQVDPLGNAARTIDSQGNLSGQIDTSHRTTYSYYPAGSTPTIPLVCTGGNAPQTAPEQAQGLQLVAAPGRAATRYVYDAAGRTLAKTDGAGTTCTSYDSEGRVASTTDGDGNRTSYAYDPAGNKRTVTRADGSTSSTAYDEAEDPIASTDTAGHTTSYSYDAEGNLLKTVDPLGIVTRSSFDAVGNKLSDTDGAGNVTNYTYDALNRLVSTTSPLGEVSRTGYDAAGNVNSRTDANGDTTNYGYDLDRERVSVTDPLNHTSSSTYDNAGRLLSTTDANNQPTSFVYDLNGDKIEIDAADGGHTYLAYDAAGDLVSKVDPRGSGPGDSAHMTSYRYDAAGRLIATTLPTGETTATAWDAAGNKLAATDAAGHTTTFAYDVLNRLISTTTPLGETTKLGYDAAGDLATRTDALGHRWSYSYDADGRRVAIHDPLGNTTTTAYDQNGNPILDSDALGNETKYRYDADGREIEVVAPDGGINSLSYDAAGNVLTRKDSLDHVTQYAYDADGRLSSVTDPLGDVTSYGYDPAGNRISVVDANGNATQTAGDGTTAYGYDAANRVTSISYSDSTPGVAYGYDLAGNRISMTDGAGTQTYAYDNSNRLTTVTRGGGSFGYTYNSAGQLASRSYPGGASTSYTYNADGETATATTADGTSNYTYDRNGQLTATQYPNGWTENRSYDNAGRLADISSSNGSETIAEADYTRDGNGNPTQILRDGTPENYVYDSSGRVTAVCYGAAVAGCPSADLIQYTYDTEGNRLTQTNAGVTTDYSYNAADELTQASVTGGATTAYTYDANGNELTAGSKGFTYDLAGKVTTISDNGTTLASFSYDGLGNRLTKTTGAGTTSYLWDENASLPSLAEELNGSTLVRGYQPGPDNGAGLDPIAMTSSGGTYYYSSDGLGSTAAITDQAGTVEWRYTYDPYGNARTTSKIDPSAPDNLIGFAGQLLDAETGLYDMRARLYDPSTGRFLSTDPMPLPPTQPAVSLYLYSADDPTVLTDPAGNTAVCNIDYCTSFSDGKRHVVFQNNDKPPVAPKSSPVPKKPAAPAAPTRVRPTSYLPPDDQAAIATAASSSTPTRAASSAASAPPLNAIPGRTRTLAMISSSAPKGSLPEPDGPASWFEAIDEWINGDGSVGEKLAEQDAMRLLRSYWGGPHFTWSQLLMAVSIIRNDETQWKGGLIPTEQVSLGNSEADLLKRGWALEKDITDANGARARRLCGALSATSFAMWTVHWAADAGDWRKGYLPFAPNWTPGHREANNYPGCSA
ncbi:MAG TPA: RHS repeat-associated core domain-containing protein [Gaiellaceae bacterium]|nr:RHS repeat-associated core domain-containing protein [Gaiellaceae bacterium]